MLGSDIESGEIIQDKTLTFGSGDTTITVLLLKQEIGRGLIGLIRSKLFDCNVGLVSVEGMPEDDGFDIAYHSHSEDGKLQCVGMEAALIDDLRHETDEAVTVLFHELGHLANHDKVYAGADFDHYNKARKEMTKNGEVLDVELKADDFAVSYLGYQTVIRGLTALIERQKRYYTPDVFEQQDIDIMINEVLHRIEHQEKEAHG